jgi:PAS domain S-box-containing protein
MLVLLALMVALPAGAVASAPFIIDAGFSSHPLGRHLEYCVDKSGAFSLDGIVSGKQDARFLPVQTDYPSFGFSRSPHWFRLKVHNVTGKTVHWILEYNYPSIDHVEAFIPETSGYRLHEGGDSIPFERREVRTRSIAFPVTQGPGEETFYLRVRSSGSLTVPLTAYSRDTFTAGTQNEMALLFLHYGIMLALALYNLFIFASTRERSYLYLALFTASIALYSMVQNGLAFQFLWPSAVRWANVSNPVFLFSSVLWAIQFSRSFLSLGLLTPRTDRVMKYFFLANLPLVLMSFFIDYFFAVQISTASAGITACLVLAAGSMLLLKGRRPARFFMLAWAAMIAGTALTALRAFGLAPSGLVSMWGYQFGSSIMVILFSFGVADQMNVLRREREKALEALKESEEKYRILVENAREGILVIVDDRPRYANRSFIDISGYSPEEFYRLDFFNDLFPDTPKGRELVRSRYHKRLKGEDTPGQYEAQMINRQGEIIDVFISAAVITIEGRTGSLSIITNISSLKKAEKTILHQYEEIQSQYEELEALNEELVSTQNELLDANDSLTREREKLAITLRSIDDAVITTDTSGRITYLNRNAETLAGFSAAEAEGRPCRDLFTMKDPAGGEVMEDPVRMVLDRGGIDNRDMVLARDSGDAVIVELNGALLRDKSGEITGTVLALRDVTAKQRLEQELQKMNRLESLGVLAGGIAHDFNNLLTAVLANTSILRTRASSDEKTQRMFTLIERAGERAVNLTRQLLTFSKGGEPIKKTASVLALLRECVELTLTGSRALCNLVQETPEKELWPLKFDVDQMSQVFNNILINAIQSMPGGGTITVAVANAGTIPEGLPLHKGRHVKISFSDQGPGIPAELQEKIFDPYFTTKNRGYGLGLATSYSIIKKHGGYIQVSSLPGTGSTFTVFLRSSSEHETVEKMLISKPAVSSCCKVLIMDDEDIIRESLAGILEQCGYCSAAAKDGREALEIYREAAEKGDPFDVVIMDLTIPGGMGGREAVAELRKIDPSALCIVSSGYSDDPVLARPGEYGFDGVITKPYKIGVITSTIEGLVKGKTPG